MATLEGPSFSRIFKKNNKVLWKVSNTTDVKNIFLQKEHKLN